MTIETLNWLAAGKTTALKPVPRKPRATNSTLSGVPREAWAYTLGNRCAIDSVLDEYKEKRPKDPTIRARFDTDRFADHQEKVIDLLVRVTTVSAETVRIVAAMKGARR